MHDPGAFEAPFVPTGNASQDTREEVSSDELVQVLSRNGASILANQEHGALLAAQRRLIFVRRTHAVGRAELRDALQSAGIGPGRFDRLLALVRGQATIEFDTHS
jgi:hypothetical protein